MQTYRTIKVPESTYERLARIGTLKDSFGSVIDRLIDAGSQHELKEEHKK